MAIFAAYLLLMKEQLLESGGFKYLERGEGKPIVILHGLMGGLSNFQGVTDYFPALGYRVIIPMLPIYDLSLLKTNVKEFALFVNRFVEHLALEDVLVVGNSLGGHIGLLFTKLFPHKVKGLIITGSSGLYESAMGGGYTKRSDYNVIKAKAEEVFYDPAVATKEIVDDVYETVNDKSKLPREKLDQI